MMTIFSTHDNNTIIEEAEENEGKWETMHTAEQAKDFLKVSCNSIDREGVGRGVRKAAGSKSTVADLVYKRGPISRWLRFTTFVFWQSKIGKQTSTTTERTRIVTMTSYGEYS
jgi:hypothetical protein